MKESETWKPVVGYEGLYEVSSIGHVRSRKTGHYRKLNGRVNRFTGYVYVNLRKDGEERTFSIHRLVAIAFLPNPDDLPYVNHKDEVKTNNSVDNLEWCSSSYNNEYSKHKRVKRISAFTLEGERLATFESESIASKMLGMSKAAVSSAISGSRKTCGGLVLRLEE